MQTAAGTTASRITGLLRLVMVAYALGLTSTADAFNLANTTPNMLHDLVLGGVLGATFVPVFVDRLTTRSRAEATESISAVLTLAFVVLVIATVFFELCAPTIIDLYTFGKATPAEHALAVNLLRIFAPQLFFYGLISLATAVLATRGRFVLAGVAPVVNNLVGIAVLAAFAAIDRQPTPTSVLHDNTLFWLLGVGTTVGVAIQAAVLIPAVRNAGLRIRPVFSLGDPAVRAIGSLSGWTVGFVIANQVTVFVILALQFHLGEGSVSEYTYAYTFFQFPFGIVATSVIAVATPTLARAYVDGNLRLVGARFGIAARRVFAFVLPSMVGYLILARPIIHLVLGHGRFGPEDASHTAAVLAMFALGLPGFCVYFLAVRTFQAMQDTRTAFFLYALENGVNIVLALVLYRSLGVQGLALAFSIAYTVGAIVALVILRERLGTIGGRAFVRTSGRALGLSVAMAIAVAFVAAILGTGNGLIGWLRLFAEVGVGAIVYLAGAGAASNLTAWQTSRRTSPPLPKRSPGGRGSHRH
jgi:putative peptidoglycan lipid II flippase